MLHFIFCISRVSNKPNRQHERDQATAAKHVSLDFMENHTLRQDCFRQNASGNFSSASKPVSRILFPDFLGTAIIPLAPPLLTGSSDLPESHRPVAAVRNHNFWMAGVTVITDRRYRALRSGPLLLSYLVLLRAGFTLPSISLPRRCALTLSPINRAAPFHPYPENSGRYVFCGTFRAGGVRPDRSGILLRPSLLTSTLPFGVRTFLSFAPACPPQTLADPLRALVRSSDRPACSRYFYVNLPSWEGQTTSSEYRWSSSGNNFISRNPGGQHDL